MNEEELDSIQELIERKLLMAEVMGGSTSHDKKFIDLWNYTIQLQNNWNELKKWLEEESNNTIYATGHLTAICMTLNKMQELQGDDKN